MNTQPAFPFVPSAELARQPNAPQASTGMTLRDYFAAAAVRSLSIKDAKWCAEQSYKIADEMLKAREAKP